MERLEIGLMDVLMSFVDLHTVSVDTSSRPIESIDRLVKLLRCIQ